MWIACACGEMNLSEPIELSPPRVFQMEPVGPAKAPALMSLEAFRALLDEQPNLRTLQLQGAGEPLAHPFFFDMVSYAAARGIDQCVASGLARLELDPGAAHRRAQKSPAAALRGADPPEEQPGAIARAHPARASEWRRRRAQPNRCLARAATFPQPRPRPRPSSMAHAHDRRFRRGAAVRRSEDRAAPDARQRAARRRASSEPPLLCRGCSLHKAALALRA